MGVGALILQFLHLLGGSLHTIYRVPHRIEPHVSTVVTISIKHPLLTSCLISPPSHLYCLGSSPKPFKLKSESQVLLFGGTPVKVLITMKTSPKVLLVLGDLRPWKGFLYD